MRFRIHFVHDRDGGYEDYLILEGDTIEEIREKACEEMDRRKPDDWWSEEIG